MQQQLKRLLFNDTNIANLRQVYELSIASLDIESYTREISRILQYDPDIIIRSGKGNYVRISEVSFIRIRTFTHKNGWEEGKFYAVFSFNRVPCIRVRLL